MIGDVWRFILAIFDRMDKIHISLIAAGVAFYAMFAVFPGLAALFALWGLWYDPALIEEYMRAGSRRWLLLRTILTCESGASGTTPNRLSSGKRSLHASKSARVINPRKTGMPVRSTRAGSFSTLSGLM